MGGNEGRKTLRAEPQMQRPERTTVGPTRGGIGGVLFWVGYGVSHIF